MIGRCLVRVSLLLCLACSARSAFAQIDEARQAIAQGEFVRAVNILSDALANRPVADTYLYLGVAYANMKDYARAEEVLEEGSQRFTSDPRFHNEIAGTRLARNDIEGAKTSLRQALEIEPRNDYASDLLATIDMSEGNVEGALRFWNSTGKPIIGEVQHNYFSNFGSWVVPKASAFRPEALLRYNSWKTTEARLLETEIFTNVALEVEPTVVPDRYNAVIRTTRKTNDATNILFGLVRGAIVKTSYLDFWDIGSSGVNLNSSFRWDPSRRRADGHLKVPLPFPGLLFLDIRETWRSEQWDLTPVIRSESRPRAEFRLKSTGIRVGLRHIPDHHFEIGAGFEYVNRAASGDLPELFTDSRNTGRLLLDTTFRFGSGVYQNRLRLEAFAARPSLRGDFRYTAGTAEINNRIALTADARTHLDVTLKGGTSRGRLPVEDYFVLGLDLAPTNILRGHSATADGRYGRAPMGTDFVLTNFDVEHRLVRVPMFNTFNLPYLTIKTEIFLDAAKTFDRSRIFQQGKLLIDVGGGLRFETPSHSLNVVLGRSLRDGTGVFLGYIERRFW